MQGCHAMRLEDLPLPKSKDDFYRILFKILPSYLTDFNCLGIFGFFNYSLIIISHNKKKFQNKMTPQLFVYYLKVMLVILYDNK